MIGLWEAGMGPQRMNLHVAFSVDLDNLLQAADRLREANIIPLDFAGEPTDEPVVFVGCPLPLSFSTILTVTCWNSFRCCLMLRNAISESSGGVAGSRLKRMKQERLARYRQIKISTVGWKSGRTIPVHSEDRLD